VDWYEGSADRFDQGLLRIAGDNATTGEIGDWLDSRNYNWTFSGGGFAVDTRKAYKGWAMMQIMSPENVGLSLGMYSPSKLPSTRGLNLALPAVSAASNIEKAAWAQTTFSTSFSKTGQKILSKAAGQPIRGIDDAVVALKSGKLSVSDLPIDVVVREGSTLMLNTRSSVTLTKAGIPRSQWNVVNRTGQELYENLLNGQLQRNNLTNAGTNAVRQSGTQNVISY